MRSRSRLQDIKYYIPFWGTRKLLKRLRRLEKDLEQVRANNEGELMYHEGRIEALYDAICERLIITSPAVDPQALKLREKKLEES